MGAADSTGATTVMAVVLTFNAPDAAAQCVDAIAQQSSRVDTVLVVDNASTPAVDLAPRPEVPIEILRLAENVGPAGGYAAGLRAFLASTAQWVWLVDDDCTPRPDALAAQLALAAAVDRPTAFLATMVDRETGAVVNTHGWCGVLVPRAIVSAVGLPLEELFWWSEDTEYLQWRIPRFGFGLKRCDDAIVEVELRRPERMKPAWKFYYEARNQVYYRLWIQRQPDDGPPRSHLRFRVRLGRAARTVTKLSARALVREPGGRGAKFAMVVRGTADGLRKRLGRTVPVNIADRPISTPGASGGRIDAEEPLDLEES